MAGVKGRSGRGIKRDEKLKVRVIDKSWDVIETYLADPTIKLKDKADIAVRLVVKDLPDKVEGKLNVTMMPSVTINDLPLELDIG